MGFCGKCCAMYCFFSYAAATVVYFIIAIFASTGNSYILVEHLKSSNDLEDVKSRTTKEYFLGAGISLGIAIILFLFCILKIQSKEKRDTYMPSLQKITQQDEPGMINDNNTNIMNNRTETMPIEMAIDKNKSINDNQYGSEKGMKEI